MPGRSLTSRRTSSRRRELRFEPGGPPSPDRHDARASRLGRGSGHLRCRRATLCSPAEVSRARLGLGVLPPRSVPSARGSLLPAAVGSWLTLKPRRRATCLSSHGFHFDRPLRRSELYGGLTGAVANLELLGFEIVEGGRPLREPRTSGISDACGRRRARNYRVRPTLPGGCGLRRETSARGRRTRARRRAPTKPSTATVTTMPTMIRIPPRSLGLSPRGPGLSAASRPIWCICAHMPGSYPGAGLANITRPGQLAGEPARRSVDLMCGHRAWIHAGGSSVSASAMRPAVNA
jgi:hypothetical protein